MNQRPAQPASPTHHSTAVPDGTAVDSVSQLLHHLDEIRQARREDCVGLLDDVDAIRRRRQRECVHLLQELTPHLHAARTVERELDRQLARRFNVFRYLRDDELGLSRIIADLLDPTAEHGQGSTFLESMLELLEVAPEVFDSGGSRHAASGRRDRAATWKALPGRRLSIATDKIRVVPERGLPGRKRIDITVDIPTDDGFFCLAFENKPYADDQLGQCRDYLEFLDSVYRGRFLLVYLPPRYRLPDESSLPPPDRERWKNHFRVLPYFRDDAPLGDDDPFNGNGRGGEQADSGEDDALVEDDPTDRSATAALDDAAVGDGASLADWFGSCCTLSDAERLRWFLREAQLFCQQHFGDSTMTDTEARYIREYLDENPKHLHAAFAVARAWPAVKHEVSRRFLEHLRDTVEERFSVQMPEIRDDPQVICHYEGDKKWSNRLVLMRRIKMESGSRGPNAWIWGVANANPKTLRDELLAALKRRGLSLQHASDGWPQYEYLPRYGHWDRLVPELVQELADGGGKITEYYVNGLLKIAEKAIPAFDEVEQP